MKSIVIYHSITGNTKKIAQAIHSGMSQAGSQSDIVRLKDVDAQSLADYDLIGVGSPVMYFRELGNMTNFIGGMRNVEGKHGFAYCTHGAVPGSYLARVVPALAQRGMVIIGWNDWFGSAYFPCIPKPYLTDGHPDDIDLREAEDFGREMVERSQRVYTRETELIPVFPKGKEYDNIYNPRMSQRRPEDGQPDVRPPQGSMQDHSRKFSNTLSLEFKVNKEKCRYPECTFCIDNCPMNAIDFTVSPPMFNRDCEKCFLCEMACPQGAIEYDYEPLQSMHDNEVVKNVLGKSLDIFEARGRFRRLVSMDEVGWDTPFYKFKKPRYKIAN